VHKLSGGLESALNPQTNTAQVTIQFRKTGKPKVAHMTTAKITARRKSTEWSALEKPVAPLPRPPEIHLLELAKGFEPPTL
jgi:hypothetical protein